MRWSAYNDFSKILDIKLSLREDSIHSLEKWTTSETRNLKEALERERENRRARKINGKEKKKRKKYLEQKFMKSEVEFTC